MAKDSDQKKVYLTMADIRAEPTVEISFVLLIFILSQLRIISQTMHSLHSGCTQNTKIIVWRLKKYRDYYMADHKIQRLLIR